MKQLEGKICLVHEAQWALRVKVEIGECPRTWGGLLYAPAFTGTSAWADDTWEAPCLLEYRNPAQAAAMLRELCPGWTSYVWRFHDQAKALGSLLGEAPPRALDFPPTTALPKTGIWSIVAPGQLVASRSHSSPFSHGRLELRENHKDPPSTAYLKLREAFLRLGTWPKPGELCLDAGACPGGWTWQALESGARVLAWDRSPLDQRLMGHPRLEFHQGDVFKVHPRDLPALDWLLCDVICYPTRLWDWVEAWLESGQARHMVITLKMQGDPDWPVMARFRQVAGSLLYHGRYNKNELTWIWRSNDEGK